jgi:hypothetical protein
LLPDATVTVMSTDPNRPAGNCPCCHRLDISHRVIVGPYERLACHMCAAGYKKMPGVAIETLTSRQIQSARERVA